MSTRSCRAVPKCIISLQLSTSNVLWDLEDEHRKDYRNVGTETLPEGTACVAGNNQVRYLDVFLWQGQKE